MCDLGFRKFMSEKRALLVREACLFSRQSIDYVPRAHADKVRECGQGSSVEFATRDWHIRRCAAEGAIEARFPNVTDPVTMMLDAGSIFRGNLGFGRQRPKGSLLESRFWGGGGWLVAGWLI